MISDEGNKIEVSLHEASYYQLINALSYAYQYALTSKIDLDVDVLWSSDWVDDSFNFLNWDEPESFLEKFNYIDAMMEFPERPKINFNHVINYDTSSSYEEKIKFIRKCKALNRDIRGFEHKDVTLRTMLWPLKNNSKRLQNKVTFWKPTFIHKMMGQSDDTTWVGRRFGLGLYSYHEYEEIKNNLQESGYNLVEIEYRTPIREIYYHLATSEFSFGYSGLCQNISVCLGTPTILTRWKKGYGLNYDHLMPKVKPEMFRDRDFINSHVEIGKKKISYFKHFYEHLYWSWK